jgi:acetyl-CoA acetyltransferase
VTNHPFRDVAIVGVFNTAQARILDGLDSGTVALQAALGAVADAGLSPRAVDGVVGEYGREFAYQARCGPVWRSQSSAGIGAVIEAANAITAGLATTVVVFAGQAGAYQQRDATAPWTRPANEFVAAYGMYTAAEFALIARRHMYLYGTKPEALATVAATIRNNGNGNPGAVYYGRGPFTPDDILNSRMIADPFHLLDCAMTAEGGCGIVLSKADRAADLAQRPVYILGAGFDAFGPSYQHPPSFELGGSLRGDLRNGTVGRRAAEMAFSTAGLGPADVDTCEFYDPFSFEIIRQFEAFGFCGEGEGGDFVMDGTIEVGGRFPVTTDGGTMSFSHAGTAQMLQRVGRGAEQVRGTCVSGQVEGVEVSMCTVGGAGAMFNDVVLLGSERP